MDVISLYSPFASLTLTFNRFQVSSCPSRFFLSLRIPPTMVSVSTSIRSAAYCIFCNSSVASPVCFARVLRSSASFPALTAKPANPASAPPAAIDKPFVLSANEPNFWDSFPAVADIFAVVALNELAASSAFLNSASHAMISL